jgi:CRP/FNR family transcriptional regulator, cyclic AMP receptor protein
LNAGRLQHAAKTLRHGSSDTRASEFAGRTVAYRANRQPNILGSLTEAERATVLRRGKQMKFVRGQTLFAQGERHQGVFIVESGLIRTFYASPSGREITLAYWKPGNIVGTPTVLGAGTYMWSGVAAEDTTVIAFQGSDLHSLMRKIPSLAIGMVEALEFKGKCLSSLVQMLGTRDVSERLVMLLSNLGETHGARDKAGVSIGSPFTHEVFAQMVGASRQWVTITLDRFQREGMIRVGRRKTVLLKRTDSHRA